MVYNLRGLSPNTERTSEEFGGRGDTELLMILTERPGDGEKSKVAGYAPEIGPILFGPDPFLQPPGYRPRSSLTRL
jgi:hypothetical protein